MKFEQSLKKPGFTKPVLVTKENFQKLGYPDPTLITGYGAFYYACDRDPTGSEPDIYTGYPDFLASWWNQPSGQIWWLQNNTTVPLQWQSTQIGMNRDYAAVSSPAFGTIYTPNTMLDIYVTGIVSLTSTLITASQVNLLVNGTIRATESLSGLAASTTRTLSAWIPANGTYQLVDVHSNATLVGVNELTC